MILEELNVDPYPDRECMLTTIDNPYNPFTHWDEWLKFDRDQDYYTNEYLARVADTDVSMSNEENDRATRAAMVDIVKYNPTKLWVLVYKPKSDNDAKNA